MYRNNGAISLSRTVKTDGRKEKTIKFCKQIGMYRIGIFFVLIGFIYHSIDTTISYLKYETLFDLKSEILSQETPSVSLCLDSFEEILRLKQLDTKNKSIGELLFSQIDCKIQRSERSPFEECGEYFEIIESSTPYAHRCITFFSQLNFNQNYSVSPYIDIIIKTFGVRRIWSIIHQTRTPPHLFEGHVSHKDSYVYYINLFSSKVRLLPFPYQTNCNSYKQNPHKSREHCILDHMKRLEYDYCGCNRKWFYKSLNNCQFESICAENKCKVEYNQKILNSKCRKNCYNEYYNNRIVVERLEDINSNRMMIGLRKEEKKELHFIHSPKMVFIQYLGSIGGLISFWFGYSLYDITSKLLSKFSNSSLLRFYDLNCRCILWAEKKCLKAILIIFFCLLSYQIFEEIQNYTKYETIYKTEIRRQIYLPNIGIFNRLGDRNIEGLTKVYPEFGDKIKELEKIVSMKFQIKEFIGNLSLKYWRKLLEDNRYTEFMDLLNSTKLVESCNLVINGESIECGQIVYRIVSEDIYNIYEIGLILGNLNESHKNLLLEKDIERNLEKITIELKRFEFNIFVFKSRECLFFDEMNFDTNVYFSSYSRKKLSKPKFRCKKMNSKNSIFQTNDANDRLNDCLIHLINQSFGCLALQLIEMKIDVNQHLLNEGYRICSTNISVNYSILKEIRTKCLGFRSKDCKEVHFENQIEFNRKLNNSSKTKRINFIPNKTAHIEYLESLKIDFDQLIYTCTGIVGLWFGLSPNQISNLLSIIWHYFKLFVNYLFRFIKIFA
jgi:hypothetical protein